MEYEIGDDPQGLLEQTDGDRDGGLRERRVRSRNRAPITEIDEDSPIQQLGEVA